MPRAADLAGVRTACRLGRSTVSEVVKKICLSVSAEAASTDCLSDFLKPFVQLKILLNLPSNRLSSLRPGLCLTTLTLTGTATDSDLAVLANIVTLRGLRFQGPITLTTERFCTLGGLPQITCLAFDNVLFPRTPYGDHACKTAVFAQLQRLELHNSCPLTRNGADSGSAGRQFLSAMRSLTALTIEADAVTQVLLEALDKLPALKHVRLWGSTAAFKIEQWLQWANPKHVDLLIVGTCSWF